MYFILSKLLLFLLYPVLWGFALLIAALIAKDSKRRKRLLIASIIVLYLVSVQFLVNMLASVWSIGPVLIKEPKVYDCAIVLGGFSSEDKNGNGYFNCTADRFIQGMKMLTTGRAKHLLITGGNGSLIQGKFREGTWVKTQLKEFNIPDSVILIESNSKNTIENATFSKPILEKAGLKPPYLLITSDFHMRRARMVFKKEGYNVVPYPCNFMMGNGKIGFADFIPDGEAIGGWNLYLKEMVGYVVDYWKK